MDNTKALLSCRDHYILYWYNNNENRIQIHCHEAPQYIISHVFIYSLFMTNKVFFKPSEQVPILGILTKS